MICRFCIFAFMLHFHPLCSVLLSGSESTLSHYVVMMINTFSSGVQTLLGLFLCYFSIQHAVAKFLGTRTSFLQDIQAFDRTLTLSDSPCVSTSGHAWILCTVARSPSFQSLVQLHSSSSPGDNTKQKFKPRRKSPSSINTSQVRDKKAKVEKKRRAASQVLLDLLVLA